MSYVLNFYSGVEPEHHYKAACWAGVQNMLMSYLYLIKNPSGLLAERHALTPNVKFMIDSGAHTLQGSMTKAPFNKWKMRDIEQFLGNFPNRITHFLFGVQPTLRTQGVQLGILLT